jgi:hypothetical protein
VSVNLPGATAAYCCEPVRAVSEQFARGCLDDASAVNVPRTLIRPRPQAEPGPIVTVIVFDASFAGGASCQLDDELPEYRGKRSLCELELCVTATTRKRYVFVAAEPPAPAGETASKAQASRPTAAPFTSRPTPQS